MGLPLLSPLSKAMTDVTHQPIMNGSPLMMLLMVVMAVVMTVGGRVTMMLDETDMRRCNDEMYINMSMEDQPSTLITYDDELVRMTDEMYDVE